MKQGNHVGEEKPLLILGAVGVHKKRHFYHQCIQLVVQQHIAEGLVIIVDKPVIGVSWSDLSFRAVVGDYLLFI